MTKRITTSLDVYLAQHGRITTSGAIQGLSSTTLQELRAFDNWLELRFNIEPKFENAAQQPPPWFASV